MEREIHDDCGHTACKCCTTRLASCTTLNNTRVVCTNNCTFYQRSLGTCTENCTTYDDNVGTCVDYRMCTNPLEQQCCVEPGCVCCDRCSAQPFCDDGYGVCRERCGREERHLHRGCKESGCKCCTSRLATCRNVASCPGECRDRRLCFQPIANYTCDGPDCMCCDTCSEESSVTTAMEDADCLAFPRSV
nr:metallothionein-1-like [Cherax quadricarinatus]